MKTKILILSALLMLGALQAKTQEKYAIGMFHFNLQYVAGDYRIESRIIRESFVPCPTIF